MLRHHFEQVHEEQGTHVSALHASEPAIYGRHGYGLASQELQVSLGRGTTLTAPELQHAAAAVTTRLATVSDPGVPKRMRECHLGAAGLGSVVGDSGYYAASAPSCRGSAGQGVLADPLRPPRRRGRRVRGVPPYAQVGACPARRRARRWAPGRRPGASSRCCAGWSTST